MTERPRKNYEDYYEIIGGIDSGGYGTVYKGREKGMNLKKIKENLIYEIDEKYDIKEKLKSYINGFIKEFEIMKKCCYNNNNSVKC